MKAAISPPGQIVLTMLYVGMGLGACTSIPMLIAEELKTGAARHPELGVSRPQPRQLARADVRNGGICDVYRPAACSYHWVASTGTPAMPFTIKVDG